MSAIIISERMTCIACPVQWEGTTDDGQKFYFRFRSGVVSLGFGPTEDAAVHDSMSNKMRISDSLDGSMNYEQYRHWFNILAEIRR